VGDPVIKDEHFQCCFSQEGFTLIPDKMLTEAGANLGWNIQAVLPAEKMSPNSNTCFINDVIIREGCCKTLRLNNANQQHPRRSREPGQGRERMGGQFAGYIPANRAERFREADRR
jgi:hypothetical protein